jgi:GT2 family glycosyltransferase
VKLSVIIPSKNINNLVPCVRAVRQHEPSAEIIVIDDGLPNVGIMRGLDRRDRAAFDGVWFVGGMKPFVYARNCNIGIAEAYRHPDTIDVSTHTEVRYVPGENPDGVVLLNDDALLMSPGGFTLLAQAASDHPEYGVIGGVSGVTGNRNQRPRGIGLREDSRMVCFFCVYIPRTTIERIGLLDERYVGYGLDDDDYCWRVKNAGLKIGIHDGCVVDHGSLTSSYRGDPRTPADYGPNLKLFIQKFGHDNFGRPAK